MTRVPPGLSTPLSTRLRAERRLQPDCCGFARQQELTPLPIDPRSLLLSLRPMLILMLGLAIRIEEDLQMGLWKFRTPADPN